MRIIFIFLGIYREISYRKWPKDCLITNVCYITISLSKVNFNNTHCCCCSFFVRNDTINFNFLIRRVKGLCGTRKSCIRIGAQYRSQNIINFGYQIKSNQNWVMSHQLHVIFQRLLVNKQKIIEHTGRDLQSIFIYLTLDSWWHLSKKFCKTLN